MKKDIFLFSNKSQKNGCLILVFMRSTNKSL